MRHSSKPLGALSNIHAKNFCETVSKKAKGRLATTFYLLGSTLSDKAGSSLKYDNCGCNSFQEYLFGRPVRWPNSNRLGCATHTSTRSASLNIISLKPNLPLAEDRNVVMPNEKL
jgi:hypothetical protein